MCGKCVQQTYEIYKQLQIVDGSHQNTMACVENGVFVNKKVALLATFFLFFAKMPPRGAESSIKAKV